MPPSLQTVVRRMNLRPVAGTGRPGVLDAAVRWVAVSELADPTPYLEGGELLLTTGMRMEGDLTGYVARLVRRGVAGLGFGVGVSHEEVPPALASAAESAGLPLLEVPRETPFIAVGKAVSELLAAEQYEEISRAFAAQGRLTRAALRPEGMHAVIDRLARKSAAGPPCWTSPARSATPPAAPASAWSRPSSPGAAASPWRPRAAGRRWVRRGPVVVSGCLPVWRCPGLASTSSCSRSVAGRGRAGSSPSARRTPSPPSPTR
ncbi:PucR family transcriptional regulator ligand-binding domain-containing protein [Nonomuraea rubra]|uniref:PucR family transcriptional regulator ligand-binding domain-containing protein n=1 Tax=Nonomuraea rubra TaxID=46180 RepID=UPI00360C1AD7